MNDKRNRMGRALLFAPLLLVLAAGGAAAQNEAEGAPEKRTATIEIRLPSGVVSEISIEPGDRTIGLIVPRGAQFPLDFEEVSNGLVRTGSVTPQGDGTVRLDLELARGVLERVDYRPDGVDLHLGTRSLSSSSGATDNYVLGPDDILQFTVHNDPNLSRQLTVTREGTIIVPLLGEVSVAGMTPREAAIYLGDRLGRSYLVDPQVDLDVIDFRSQWVMLTGEIATRGRQVLRGGTRLKEILAEAGGLTLDAGESITISRKKPGSSEYEVLQVDRDDFEHGEVDPVLNHGDIIDVPRTEYAYVQGEVRQPTRLAIERGLTLMRAVALVGGLTEWADRKEIRIVYPQEDGRTRVETYNLRKIQLGKAPDPELHGGETIIVDRRFF